MTEFLCSLVQCIFAIAVYQFLSRGNRRHEIEAAFQRGRLYELERIKNER